MAATLVSLLPLIIGAALVPLLIIAAILLLTSEKQGPLKAVAFVVGMTLVRLAQGLLFGFVFNSIASRNIGDKEVSMIRRSLPLALLTGLMLALAAAHAPAASADSPMYRAFWVDAFHDGIKTPAQVDRLIADLDAANMNAIVVQVVRRGDCYCNHATAPRTQDPLVTPGFDPLAYLIEKAHAANPPIEVHAWIIATAIWNSATPPLDPSHVFNTHGPTATGRDMWLMVRSDGTTRLGSDWYVDPGHPDAAAYIASIATSIVQNYDVDGINLDRIRYPDSTVAGRSWSYNPTAVARFNARYGRTGTPDNSDPDWQQWRRDQVTSLVRRIYLATTAIKPTVKVSADTITYGYGPTTWAEWLASRTYSEVYQDWVGWMGEGILDLNIPMNYKREHLAANSPTACGGNQQLMFGQWDAWARAQLGARQMIMGNAAYLNYTENTVRQFRQSLTPDAGGRAAVGVAAYSYGAPAFKPDPPTRDCGGVTVPHGTTVDSNTNVAEADAFRAQLSQQLTTADPDGQPPLFAAPAAIPAMPWKETPSQGHLMGFVSRHGEATENLFVQIISLPGNHIVRTVQTEANGFFGVVGLTPGDYRIVTYADPWDPQAFPRRLIRHVHIMAGQVETVTFE